MLLACNRNVCGSSGFELFKIIVSTAEINRQNESGSATIFLIFIIIVTNLCGAAVVWWLRH
jgi:hypothetical protein